MRERSIRPRAVWVLFPAARSEERQRRRRMADGDRRCQPEPRAMMMLTRSSLPCVRSRCHPALLSPSSALRAAADENPRNVGSLPKTDSNVGTGLVGAPACGDVMKLQVQVSPTGVITRAVFKTFGCGSAIASSSLATSWAEGKHIDEVVKIKNTDIAKHLALPPVKLHCSMLAEDAIKAAVADYKTKQAAKNGATATAASDATAAATATTTVAAAPKAMHAA